MYVCEYFTSILSCSCTWGFKKLYFFFVWFSFADRITLTLLPFFFSHDINVRWCDRDHIKKLLVFLSPFSESWGIDITIGEGGFGTVFKAKPLPDGCKLVPWSWVFTGEEVSERPTGWGASWEEPFNQKINTYVFLFLIWPQSICVGIQIYFQEKTYRY